MNTKTNEYQIIQRVSLMTIIANVLLSIAKLTIGIIFMSFSVISDSIHTLSDVFTTIIVMIGIKFASKPRDNEHNYGHEKIESIFSIILAFILFVTGAFLGYKAITTLINNNSDFNFSYLLIIITAVSVISKEAMYHYTIHYAKKYHSTALKADAWHHRSDSLSSIAVLIGLILTVTLNLNWAEPIATILVAILIIKTSISIILTAISQLIDKAADTKTIESIKDIVLKISGVLAIDKLLTRQYSSKLYVDIEIAADGNQTLNETHKIAEKVHITLEKADLRIKHCTVHVNPYKPKKEQEIKNFFD